MNTWNWKKYDADSLRGRGEITSLTAKFVFRFIVWSSGIAVRAPQFGYLHSIAGSFRARLNFGTGRRQPNLRARRIQHDRDSKFSAAFTEQLRKRRVKTQRSSFCAPNMNAYIERFIQTLRKECLDHFVILGTKHLDHLCREFAVHYHEERPHQSLDNEPIVKPPPHNDRDERVVVGEIRCRQRLGGLLKSYGRKAA